MPKTVIIQTRRVGEKKKKFVASHVAMQGFFIPLRFPSLNEYSRMTTQTFGRDGHRGNRANTLKHQIETKIQLYIRLANLAPMEHVVFFFEFVEQSRIRNKDNITSTAKKLIFDAMQKAGIIRNDGWKEIVYWNEEFTCVPDGGVGVRIRMYDPKQCNDEIRIQLVRVYDRAIVRWREETGIY